MEQGLKQEKIDRLKDRFYMETDRKKRVEILDELIALEGDTDENRIRKEIITKRYGQKDGYDVDYFIRGWVIMNAMRGRRGPMKGLKKEAEEALESWQMAPQKAANPAKLALIEKELFNMTVLYMELCERDHTFNSILWGFGHISDEKRNIKIMDEVIRVAYATPLRIGMQDEFAPFARAAKAAFDAAYPDLKDMLAEEIKKVV